MTRATSQIRAVSIAVLVVLSVVAGSVTFAGSVAAVDNVTAEEQFDPLEVDENTETTHSFNYSFSGINTAGNTTLTFSVPGEYPAIVGHDIVVKNATGAELGATVTDDPRTLSFEVNSTTETVYFDGSVTLDSPSVETDQNYTIKFNGTDEDGDVASAQEEITVENVPGTLSIGDGGFSPTEVDQETENRHEFNYSIDGLDTNEDSTFEIDVPSEFTIESHDVVVKNATGSELGSLTESDNTLTYTDQLSTESAYLAGSLNLTSPAVPEGQENATYDVAVDVSDDGGRSVSATEGITVEYVGGQPGDPEFLSAIQFVQSDGTPAIEVAFSEDIQDFDSNYGLYVDEEEEVTGDIVTSVDEAQGRVIIELNETDSRDLTLRLEDGIVDSDGNSLANPDNPEYKPITFAPTTIGGGDDTNVYKGSVVSIVAANSETDVTLEGTDDDTDNYFFQGSTGVNSRIFLFDTEGEETGDYEADIDGEGTASITVRNLDLSVSIDDRNVTTLETIDGTVSAQVSGREIRLELLDDSDEVVDERFVDLSGQGKYDFSYDSESLNLETGEYTIRATDTAAGVTVESDTIEVTEAGDTEVLLPSNVISEARGDVVAIPLTLENTREATLIIGDDEAGYEASVTVRDGDGDDRDGEVTVYFNTYAASSVGTGTFSGENDLFSVSDDDEVVDGEVTIGVSDLLDAEAYPLSAQTGGRETDVQLLTLEERSTTSIRTLTAPRNEYSSLNDPEEIREGTGEYVTETSDVAVGDTVLYEIQASGLEGALDARGEDTVTTEFFDFANGSGSNPAAQFSLVQQDPGPNQDPLVLDLDSSNARVVADSANDTYYVVTRTGEDGPEGVEDADGDGVIDPDETERGTVDADDDLRATFTVFGEDENDLDLTADGEDESVETSHSLTEPEIEINDPFNVTEVSGQEIFGEATVAPGTELSIRVRSGDGVRPAFLKTAETTVDANGEFLVTLSFNDTSPGDTYTITVSDIGPAPDATADGTVQPVIQTATSDTPAETTTSETPTTTTTETTTETTSTTTMTEIPTVQTSTTTPGFGVIAALVAFAGGALLALRRE
jgi:surface glycoprotein (TIGR04207 family)/PGF-CTERM protein